MAPARKSIFVSHVNEDQDAEPLLKALEGQLCAALGADLSDYEVVYDRIALFPGQDWRTQIYNWLEECPAAVILISPGAFDPKKPWVAQETFFLCVRRNVRRNLAVVPVFIAGTRTLIDQEPDFLPSQITEIQGILYDPNADEAITRLVADVATALRTSLPPVGKAVAEGLAGDLAETLAAHPELAEAAAHALRLPKRPVPSEDIAVAFMECNDGLFLRWSASTKKGCSTVGSL